ncbi:hypothetical protein ACHAXT_004170 [Thalassiosira profunda]
MVAAYGVIIAYSNQRGPDGQRRKLPKVDLDDRVDLGQAWEEAKNALNGMRREEPPSFPGPKSAHNSTPGASSNSAKPGDQAAR